MSVYIIYSSLLEQSVYISTLLKKYISKGKVIRVKTDEKINDESINYIHIPTGASSTEKMLINGDVVLGNIIMTTASLQVFDKNLLLKKALLISVAVPKTWQCIDDISSYPIFYKQKYEKGGGERGIALSRKDIPTNAVESLIFQELISSEGTYGVSFLAKEGCLLASLSHFESESLPQDGGSAVIIESCKDKRLIDDTKRLIKSLNYSGWGLAEYKYCPKRRSFVLMEINAKFWASCELAFVNEPKFAKLLFDIDIDEKPIDKMIFVDRAIQRGFLFFVKKVILAPKRTTLRLYSGWGVRLMVSMIPSRFYLKMKELKKLMKGAN